MTSIATEVRPKRAWPGFRFPRGLVFPVVVVIAVEVYFRLAGIQSDSLAPPTAVAVALVKGLLSGDVLRATGQTLLAAFGGLLIGGTIGLLMGVLRGLFKRVDDLLDVTTEALRPIPSSAIIPVTIVIFGFGYKLEMACVAFSSTWTVFVLTRSAVIAVEPRLMEVAKVLRLGLAARTGKIVIPAALPRIFVAFRLAASTALIVAVTTEVAANPLGLGSEMMSASQSLRPAVTLAYLVWIGFVGWVFNETLLRLQTRLFGRFIAEDSQ